MTHKENSEILKKMEEIESMIVVAEFSQASINDDSENLVLDDLEKEYAKELAVLSEKINNYKDVFFIDIQANKGRSQLFEEYFKFSLN